MTIVNEALKLEKFLKENTYIQNIETDTNPRWYVRGDGIRYKEPVNLFFGDENICNCAWDFILMLDGVRPEKNFVVSDEFPSSPRSSFAYYKSYALIKRRCAIDVVSKGRLGRGVWKLHSTHSKSKKDNKPKISGEQHITKGYDGLKQIPNEVVFENDKKVNLLELQHTKDCINRVVLHFNSDYFGKYFPKSD